MLGLVGISALAAPAPWQTGRSQRIINLGRRGSGYGTSSRPITNLSPSSNWRDRYLRSTICRITDRCPCKVLIIALRPRMLSCARAANAAREMQHSRNSRPSIAVKWRRPPRDQRRGSQGRVGVPLAMSACSARPSTYGFRPTCYVAKSYSA